MNRKGCKAPNRGFTLVELLVSIGVIVVVLSIMTPVLKNVRDRGIIARSLSGHRNIGTMVFAFGIDRNGQLPYSYIQREGSYAHSVYTVSESETEGFRPASMALQARVWASLLAKSNPSLIVLVYQGRWEPLIGQDVPNGLIGGSYVATSTMFADPQFFGIDPSNANVRQLHATRSNQIVYPSSKMMFEDLESWGRMPSSDDIYRSATFSFADGSAQGMSQAEFTGDWVQRATAWQTAPGHTTLNGLAGRDK